MIVRRVRGDAVLHCVMALGKKVSLCYIGQILIDISVTKYVHDAFNRLVDCISRPGSVHPVRCGVLMFPSTLGVGYGRVG